MAVNTIKKQSLKYRYNILGLSLIAFFMLRMYIPLGFKHIGAMNSFNVWLVVGMISLILSCLIPVLLMENLSKLHPKMFNRIKPVPTLALVGYSMMLITIISIINQFFINILGFFGIKFVTQGLQPIDNFFTFILYFIFMCIIPAFAEEIFLRGYVLSMLKPYGQSFAIIGSAVCFTLMHNQVQSFLPIFASGILLGCIYCLTESIFPCIILHFTNNALSFFMMYISEHIGGVSAFSFGVYINLFIFAVGLLSRAYLHNMGFRMSDMLKGTKQMDKKLVTLVKSPVAVMAIAVFIIMAVDSFIKGLVR